MSLTPTQAFVECPHAAAAHGGVRRMAYWRWDDEACADPDTLLVCVHGLTRQGRDFDVLARAMAPHMRVVCPDVAGRGGSDWLAEGQKATDEELSGMNFYVEGITAPMPK